MVAAAAALVEAQRALHGVQPEAFRVDMILLNVQYVMLTRWNEFKGWAAEQRGGTLWPLHDTLAEEFEAFSRTFNKSGLATNGDDGQARFQGSVAGAHPVQFSIQCPR